MDLPPKRQPGERLPAAFVKDVRTKAGLTQEQFARRLGVRGGKGVISAWESEAAACEGPVAELILHLFGGNPDFSVPSHLADAAWNRVPGHYYDWRQVLAVPGQRMELDREKFARLFPAAALPSTEYVHGFPFVDPGLRADAYGLATEGWIGSIPSEPSRPVAYWWLLQRNGSFGYREKPWESDERSVTRGNTHVRSLLEIVLATTHFLKRLAGQCEMSNDLEYGLQLRMAGTQGRGVVLLNSDPKLAAMGLVDEPPRRSATDDLAVQTMTSVRELRADPVAPGRRLVGEAMLLLRPDHASDASLDQILAQAHKMDKKEKDKGFRRLGFLD